MGESQPIDVAPKINRLRKAVRVTSFTLAVIGGTVAAAGLVDQEVSLFQSPPLNKPPDPFVPIDVEYKRLADQIDKSFDRTDRDIAAEVGGIALAIISGTVFVATAPKENPNSQKPRRKLFKFS